MMERLTFRHDTDYLPETAEPCEPIHCVDEYDRLALNQLVERLAAYEDTDLTPEQTKEHIDRLVEYESLFGGVETACEAAALLQKQRDGLVVELQGCDNCRYKLQSEAWEYYTYPCNECQQRTKNNFTEAALQEKGE